MSFPWPVIMLTVMAILGPVQLNVRPALALAGFAGASRVVRSAVLAIKESDYVMAAKAVGCKNRTILIRHILPNVTAPIIVLATLGLGNAILAEASLSFLGFGVPPPAPSWGRMLSGDGINYMLKAPGWPSFPDWPSAPVCWDSTCWEMPFGTCWIPADRRNETQEMMETTQTTRKPILDVEGLDTKFNLRDGTLNAVRDISFALSPGNPWACRRKRLRKIRHLPFRDASDPGPAGKDPGHDPEV